MNRGKPAQRGARGVDRLPAGSWPVLPVRVPRAPACHQRIAARVSSCCRFRRLLFCTLLFIGLLVLAEPLRAAYSEDLFRAGAAAYRAGDHLQAAHLLREASRMRPAAGTLQNLGNAEWRLGRVGLAVLAWEQAAWLDPFNDATRSNLKLARKTSQLEAPDLAWFEIVSTWLPVNWWALIAGMSFWTAVAAAALPGILRWRKAAWQQALAAFALAVFLLSIPAQFGVDTRSRIGFVLLKDTPLRLSPTGESQFIARMSAGDPARLQRVKGNYFLIRTSRATGWVEKSQFGLICPRP